jgi:hypothetical protein
VAGSCEHGNVRFQVLTATIVKMSVFWHVVSCGLVDTERLFRGAHSDDRPDDGGSKHL